MNRIAILSGKGGIGKSTISTLYSIYLSETTKTLIIDFDISGPSISTLLPINNKLYTDKNNNLIPIKIKENLFSLSMGYLIKPIDFVTWRLPKKLNLLKNFLNSINEFENIIIDTPPDDFFINILKEYNFNILFITTSQNLALQDLSIQIDKCLKKELKIIGILENMAGIKCFNCKNINYLFSKKGGILISEMYNLKFLGFIPNDKLIRENINNKEIDINIKKVLKHIYYNTTIYNIKE